MFGVSPPSFIISPFISRLNRYQPQLAFNFNRVSFQIFIFTPPMTREQRSMCCNAELLRSPPTFASFKRIESPCLEIRKEENTAAFAFLA